MLCYCRLLNIFCKTIIGQSWGRILEQKKSLNYIELITSAIILFLYTRKWKKECKVGAAIEWSAGSHVANWVQRRGGFLQVGFGHYTLRFSIFPYFFPFFSPKVDWSLFLFCLPKKIKRINFHLKLKIHNLRPRSSSLNITQISPLSHFSQSPRANWPHLSELAEAKTHTYIYNMGEIQNWHLSMVEDY